MKVYIAVICNRYTIICNKARHLFIGFNTNNIAPHPMMHDADKRDPLVMLIELMAVALPLGSCHQSLVNA